jgi:GNAT superfamily N-acetyltransferase
MLLLCYDGAAAMTTLATVTIKPMPLSKIGEVERLFATAVQSSFTYFDEDIQRATIHNHRRRHLLTAALNPRRMVFTAWDGAELIGYAIGNVPKTGPSQLYWLYVEPGHRGGNAGLILLSRVMRRARQLGSDNLVLSTYDHRRYYERQGFGFVETTIVHGVPMDILRYKLS